MYLHLGQNVVVPSDTVIGIFDMDNSTGSHLTRSFFKRRGKSRSNHQYIRRFTKVLYYML